MNDKKIGEFLAEQRMKKKLNQTQLAKKLSMSRTLINKIEKGRASLTSQNLKLFAEFYNLSTDEILAGEVKTKDNSKELGENVQANLVDENQSLKKKVKKFTMFIFVVLFSFLAYYFLTFYKSVNIYTFDVKDDNFSITNALLVKTFDKVYLRFESDFDEKNIDSINMYYLLNKRKTYIYKFDSKEKEIALNDRYDLQEYFNFAEFNKIKDNMYMEIHYKKGEDENIKLDLYKDYANLLLLFKKSKKKSVDKNNIELSDDEVIEKFVEKFGNKTTKVIYNKEEFKIFIVNKCIAISLENNYNIMYFYDKLYISKSINEKYIYEYDYNTNKCLKGNCKTKDDDYNLMIKLLKKALKNN